MIGLRRARRLRLRWGARFAVFFAFFFMRASYSGEGRASIGA